MHDIEPHYQWRDEYISAEDKRSPFFGRDYDEFQYSQKIYNYVIHPQWDFFGSPTLYLKVLYADYEEGFTIIEMLGEWNDCVQNDIMFLKRDVIDPMLKEGISRFIIIAENVLNFHGDFDEDYYEEWLEDVLDRRGWICLLNLFPHVSSEMQESHLHHYMYFGGPLDDINWRSLKPQGLHLLLDGLIDNVQKEIE
ncbi:MAG: hypothetical protein KDC34_14325 [Saprospiraceae bacterium]|nr:hypothetical protein [Saprospiraceae bacterium]